MSESTFLWRQKSWSLEHSGRVQGSGRDRSPLKREVKPPSNVIFFYQGWQIFQKPPPFFPQPARPPTHMALPCRPRRFRAPGRRAPTPPAPRRPPWPFAPLLVASGLFPSQAGREETTAGVGPSLAAPRLPTLSSRLGSSPEPKSPRRKRITSKEKTVVLENRSLTQFPRYHPHVFYFTSFFFTL